MRSRVTTSNRRKNQANFKSRHLKSSKQFPKVGKLNVGLGLDVKKEWYKVSYGASHYMDHKRRIRNIRISKALFQSQVQCTRLYMSGDMDNIENAEMEKLEAFEMWLWRN